MKYGIRAVGISEIQYVSSTRHRPTLTENIADIALFASAENAISAIKDIRKEGDEPKGYVLDVIEITFSIQKVFSVPYPKKKSGYILILENKYYSGTKKTSQYLSQYLRFENIEKATIFSTEKAALDRKESLIEDTKMYLSQTREHSLKYHWRNDAEENKRQIEMHQEVIDALKKIQVIKHDV